MSILFKSGIISVPFGTSYSVGLFAVTKKLPSGKIANSWRFSPAKIVPSFATIPPCSKGELIGL